MNAEKRLAYDMRCYVNGAGEVDVHRAAVDASALVLECAADPDRKVTPFVYVQTEEGGVFSPEEGRYIDEILSWETPQDILASRASLKIRDYIVSQEPPFLVVWMSPPEEKYGYKTGRIVLGIGTRRDGIKVVENYGICTPISCDEVLALANRIFQYSIDQKETKVSSGDELREIATCFRPEEDPLDFAFKLLSLPEAIQERIKNGEAQVLKERAFRDALVLCEEAKTSLEKAQSARDFVEVGVSIERGMESRGWDMAPDSGCGVFNSQIASFYYTTFEVNGEISFFESGVGVFVKECPYCHRSINKIIFAGYKCACGKVYTGVCKEEKKRGQGEIHVEDNLDDQDFVAGLCFSFLFILVGGMILVDSKK